MERRFDSFVVFAEMRTGSNLLEDYLNRIPGVTCYGEAFNPQFIGYPNTPDILGVTQRQREDNPDRLLRSIQTQTDGLGGFRYFHDHDPRVLSTVLTNTRCAKIVLTRNPLDSYVSLKIARATDQWKLTNVSNRKDAKAQFDLHEFEKHVGRMQSFQLEIMRILQMTGQTAFYIGYNDLRDTDVLSGLAKWLGADVDPERFESALKPQNPQPLSEKVGNYAQMERALQSFDRFDLSRTPGFEPRRGPVVPSYLACEAAPLLYLPIRSGPEKQVVQWLTALNNGVTLTGKFNQKSLRNWMSDHPAHRRFTVLRHPLARAHAAFCEKILSTGPGSFSMIRNQLARFHRVELPDDPNEPGYEAHHHKAAFSGFLKFLRANLNRQTSIRVDAHWASQVACLQGMAEFCMPDQLIREDNLPTELTSIAEAVGVVVPPALPAAEGQHRYSLDEIYDGEIEKLGRDAYPRDYLMLGFTNYK